MAIKCSLGPTLRENLTWLLDKGKDSPEGIKLQKAIIDAGMEIGEGFSDNIDGFIATVETLPEENIKDMVKLFDRMDQAIKDPATKDKTFEELQTSIDEALIALSVKTVVTQKEKVTTDASEVTENVSRLHLELSRGTKNPSKETLKRAFNSVMAVNRLKKGIFSNIGKTFEESWDRITSIIESPIHRKRIDSKSERSRVRDMLLLSEIDQAMKETNDAAVKVNTETRTLVQNKNEALKEIHKQIKELKQTISDLLKKKKGTKNPEERGILIGEEKSLKAKLKELDKKRYELEQDLKKTIETIHKTQKRIKIPFTKKFFLPKSVIKRLNKLSNHVQSQLKGEESFLRNLEKASITVNPVETVLADSVSYAIHLGNSRYGTTLEIFNQMQRQGGKYTVANMVQFMEDSSKDKYGVLLHREGILKQRLLEAAKLVLGSPRKKFDTDTVILNKETLLRIFDTYRGLLVSDVIKDNVDFEDILERETLDWITAEFSRSDKISLDDIATGGNRKLSDEERSVLIDKRQKLTASQLAKQLIKVQARIQTLKSAGIKDASFAQVRGVLGIDFSDVNPEKMFSSTIGTINTTSYQGEFNGLNPEDTDWNKVEEHVRGVLQRLGMGPGGASINLSSVDITKLIALDIETDPTTKRIVAIALDEGQGKKQVMMSNSVDEAGVVELDAEQVLSLLKSLEKKVIEGHHITTHNGTSFDWDALVRTAAKASSMVGKEQDVINLGLRLKLLSLDTMLTLMDKTESYVSLNDASRAYGGVGKTTEQGITGVKFASTLAEAIRNNDTTTINNLTEYASGDVAATLRLTQVLLSDQEKRIPIPREKYSTLNANNNKQIIPVWRMLLTDTQSPAVSSSSPAGARAMLTASATSLNSGTTLDALNSVVQEGTTDMLFNVDEMEQGIAAKIYMLLAAERGGTGSSAMASAMKRLDIKAIPKEQREQLRLYIEIAGKYHQQIVVKEEGYIQKYEKGEPVFYEENDNTEEQYEKDVVASFIKYFSETMFNNQGHPENRIKRRITEEWGYRDMEQTETLGDYVKSFIEEVILSVEISEIDKYFRKKINKSNKRISDFGNGLIERASADNAGWGLAQLTDGRSEGETRTLRVDDVPSWHSPVTRDNIKAKEEESANEYLTPTRPDVNHFAPIPLHKFIAVFEEWKGRKRMSYILENHKKLMGMSLDELSALYSKLTPKADLKKVLQIKPLSSPDFAPTIVNRDPFDTIPDMEERKNRIIEALLDIPAALAVTLHDAVITGSLLNTSFGVLDNGEPQMLGFKNPVAGAGFFSAASLFDVSFFTNVSWWSEYGQNSKTITQSIDNVIKGIVTIDGVDRNIKEWKRNYQDAHFNGVHHMVMLGALLGAGGADISALIYQAANDNGIFMENDPAYDFHFKMGKSLYQEATKALGTAQKAQAQDLIAILDVIMDSKDGNITDSNYRALGKAINTPRLYSGGVPAITGKLISMIPKSRVHEVKHILQNTEQMSSIVSKLQLSSNKNMLVMADTIMGISEELRITFMNQVKEKMQRTMASQTMENIKQSLFTAMGDTSNVVDKLNTHLATLARTEINLRSTADLTKKDLDKLTEQLLDSWRDRIRAATLYITENNVTTDNKDVHENAIGKILSGNRNSWKEDPDMVALNALNRVPFMLNTSVVEALEEDLGISLGNWQERATLPYFFSWGRDQFGGRFYVSGRQHHFSPQGSVGSKPSIYGAAKDNNPFALLRIEDTHFHHMNKEYGKEYASKMVMASIITDTLAKGASSFMPESYNEKEETFLNFNKEWKNTTENERATRRKVTEAVLKKLSARIVGKEESALDGGFVDEDAAIEYIGKVLEKNEGKITDGEISLLASLVAERGETKDDVPVARNTRTGKGPFSLRSSMQETALITNPMMSLLAVSKKKKMEKDAKRWTKRIKIGDTGKEQIIPEESQGWSFSGPAPTIPEKFVATGVPTGSPRSVHDHSLLLRASLYEYAKENNLLDLVDNEEWHKLYVLKKTHDKATKKFLKNIKKGMSAGDIKRALIKLNGDVLSLVQDQVENEGSLIKQQTEVFDGDIPSLTPREVEILRDRYGNTYYGLLQILSGRNDRKSHSFGNGLINLHGVMDSSEKGKTTNIIGEPLFDTTSQPPAVIHARDASQLVWFLYNSVVFREQATNILRQEIGDKKLNPFLEKDGYIGFGYISNNKEKWKEIVIKLTTNEARWEAILAGIKPTFVLRSVEKNNVRVINIEEARINAPTSSGNILDVRISDTEYIPSYRLIKQIFTALRNQAGIERMELQVATGVTVDPMQSQAAQLQRVRNQEMVQMRIAEMDQDFEALKLISPLSDSDIYIRDGRETLNIFSIMRESKIPMWQHKTRLTELGRETIEEIAIRKSASHGAEPTKGYDSSIPITVLDAAMLMPLRKALENIKEFRNDELAQRFVSNGFFTYVKNKRGSSLVLNTTDNTILANRDYYPILRALLEKGSEVVSEAVIREFITVINGSTLTEGAIDTILADIEYLHTLYIEAISPVSNPMYLTVAGIRMDTSGKLLSEEQLIAAMQDSIDEDNKIGSISTIKAIKEVSKENESQREKEHYTTDLSSDEGQNYFTRDLFINRFVTRNLNNNIDGSVQRMASFLKEQGFDDSSVAASMYYQLVGTFLNHYPHLLDSLTITTGTSTNIAGDRKGASVRRDSKGAWIISLDKETLEKTKNNPEQLVWLLAHELTHIAVHEMEKDQDMPTLVADRYKKTKVFLSTSAGKEMIKKMLRKMRTTTLSQSGQASLEAEIQEYLNNPKESMVLIGSLSLLNNAFSKIRNPLGVDKDSLSHVRELNNNIYRVVGRFSKQVGGAFMQMAGILDEHSTRQMKNFFNSLVVGEYKTRDNSTDSPSTDSPSIWEPGYDSDGTVDTEYMAYSFLTPNEKSYYEASNVELGRRNEVVRNHRKITEGIQDQQKIFHAAAKLDPRAARVAQAEIERLKALRTDEGNELSTTRDRFGSKLYGLKNNISTDDFRSLNDAEKQEAIKKLLLELSNRIGTAKNKQNTYNRAMEGSGPIKKKFREVRRIAQKVTYFGGSATKTIASNQSIIVALAALIESSHLDTDKEFDGGLHGFDTTDNIAPYFAFAALIETMSNTLQHNIPKDRLPAVLAAVMGHIVTGGGTVNSMDPLDKNETNAVKLISEEFIKVLEYIAEQNDRYKLKNSPKRKNSGYNNNQVLPLHFNNGRLTQQLRNNLEAGQEAISLVASIQRKKLRVLLEEDNVVCYPNFVFAGLLPVISVEENSTDRNKISTKEWLEDLRQKKNKLDPSTALILNAVIQRANKADPDLGLDIQNIFSGNMDYIVDSVTRALEEITAALEYNSMYEKNSVTTILDISQKDFKDLLYIPLTMAIEDSSTKSTDVIDSTFVRSLTNAQQFNITSNVNIPEVFNLSSWLTKKTINRAIGSAQYPYGMFEIAAADLFTDRILDKQPQSIEYSYPGLTKEDMQKARLLFDQSPASLMRAINKGVVKAFADRRVIKDLSGIDGLSVRELLKILEDQPDILNSIMSNNNTPLSDIEKREMQASIRILIERHKLVYGESSSRQDGFEGGLSQYGGTILYTAWGGNMIYSGFLESMYGLFMAPVVGGNPVRIAGDGIAFVARSVAGLLPFGLNKLLKTETQYKNAAAEYANVIWDTRAVLMQSWNDMIGLTDIESVENVLSKKWAGNKIKRYVNWSADINLVTTEASRYALAKQGRRMVVKAVNGNLLRAIQALNKKNEGNINFDVYREMGNYLNSWGENHLSPEIAIRMSLSGLAKGKTPGALEVLLDMLPSNERNFNNLIKLKSMVLASPIIKGPGNVLYNKEDLINAITSIEKFTKEYTNIILPTGYTMQRPATGDNQLTTAFLAFRSIFILQATNFLLRNNAMSRRGSRYMQLGTIMVGEMIYSLTLGFVAGVWDEKELDKILSGQWDEETVYMFLEAASRSSLFGLGTGISVAVLKEFLSLMSNSSNFKMNSVGLLQFTALTSIVRKMIDGAKLLNEGETSHGLYQLLRTFVPIANGVVGSKVRHLIWGDLPKGGKSRKKGTQGGRQRAASSLDYQNRNGPLGYYMAGTQEFADSIQEIHPWASLPAPYVDPPAQVAESPQPMAQPKTSAVPNDLAINTSPPDPLADLLAGSPPTTAPM